MRASVSSVLLGLFKGLARVSKGSEGSFGCVIRLCLRDGESIVLRV